MKTLLPGPAREYLRYSAPGTILKGAWVAYSLRRAPGADGPGRWLLTRRSLTGLQCTRPHGTEPGSTGEATRDQISFHTRTALEVESSLSLGAFREYFHSIGNIFRRQAG